MLRFSNYAGMAMSSAAVVIAAGDELWMEKTVGEISPADKNWAPMQTFTLDQTVAAKTMAPTKLAKYGGRLDRQGKATGFFRVEETRRRLADGRSGWLRLHLCGSQRRSHECHAEWR